MQEKFETPPTRAILEFNLSDPEGKEDFRIYNQAHAMNSALWEFSQRLRSYYKWGTPEELKTVSDTVEFIKDQFYQVLGEYNIDLQ